MVHSVERKPLPADIAAGMGLAADVPAWRVLRRGFADDAPISLTLSWHAFERLPRLVQVFTEGRRPSGLPGRVPADRATLSSRLHKPPLIWGRAGTMRALTGARRTGATDVP